jgi:hypothetical protein
MNSVRICDRFRWSVQSANIALMYDNLPLGSVDLKQVVASGRSCGFVGVTGQYGYKRQSKHSSQEGKQRRSYDGGCDTIVCNPRLLH